MEEHEWLVPFAWYKGKNQVQDNTRWTPPFHCCLLILFVVSARRLSQHVRCYRYMLLASVIWQSVLPTAQALRCVRAIDLFDCQPLHVDDNSVLDHGVPRHFGLWYVGGIKTVLFLTNIWKTCWAFQLLKIYM